MTIAELFIKLGVDADQKSLNKITDTIGGMAKSAAYTTAALGATLFALERLASSTVQSTVNLQNFNRQTGLSIEKLQQWQTAAQLSDVNLSVDAVTSSIKALQDSINDVKLGGTGKSGILALLGISSFGNMDAFQILDQVREKIKGLDDGVATNLIQKLGLNPSFINVLRLTNEEFERLGNKKFLSQEQQRAVVELGTALTDLKIDFILLKDGAVADSANSLMRLIEIVRNVTEVSFKLGYGIVSLYEKIKKNEYAFAALIASVTALAVVFAPIQTLIVALMLVLEDLNIYLEGGDSLIGKIVEQFKAWGSAVQSVIDPMDKLFESIQKISPLLANFTFGGGVGTGIFSATVPNKERMSSLANRIASFGNNTQSGATNKTANVNNTFNIQSNQDAKDIAKSVVDQEQKSLNYALDDTNNGADL